MTKITVAEDCGNSPKNRFVLEFTIAYAERKHQYLMDRITDDIRVELVGDRTLSGSGEVAQSLRRITANDLTELTIFHAITHGRAGAVDGIKRLANGDVYAFCDFFEFSSAKAERISRATIYQIKIQ